MRSLKSLSFLIGFGFFIFLLSRLDLRASWLTLKSADPRWFFSALLFAVPEILFKSLRLRSFVAKSKSHITLRQAVWSFLSGQPLAAVTPGKLGDVSRIILLSRYARISLPAALAVHAADRIYDFAAILFLAIIGLISFLTEYQQQGPALAAALGMLSGMVLILSLLNPRWLRLILKPLVMGILSKDLAQQLSRHGKEFYEKLQALLVPSFRLFGPFVLSLLAWETAILRAYFCAMALGLALPILKFVLLVPLMIMVELLPISILGFGPREAALFLLFTSGQLPKESLLAFSLLIVMAGPLFVSLVGVPVAAQLLTAFKKAHEKTKL